MVTLLKRRPKASAGELPTHPGLAIDTLGADLGKKAQASLDAFHERCRAFEERVVDLFQRRTQLLDEGLDLSIRELRKRGASILTEKADAEQELLELRWVRFDLLPSLLPDAKAWLTRCEANVELAITAEQERLRGLGVDASCMPAGQHNQKAAEQQLRHKILLSDGVASAVGILNAAKSFSQGIYASIGNVPRSPQCVLDWPAVGDPDARLIASAAGVL